MKVNKRVDSQRWLRLYSFLTSTTCRNVLSRHREKDHSCFSWFSCSIFLFLELVPRDKKWLTFPRVHFKERRQCLMLNGSQSWSMMAETLSAAPGKHVSPVEGQSLPSLRGCLVCRRADSLTPEPKRSPALLYCLGSSDTWMASLVLILLITILNLLELSYGEYVIKYTTYN